MNRLLTLGLNIFRRTGSKGIWALIDQGVMSLGTFAVGLLLARNLTPAEYGAFALVLGALFLLNLVHNSLITYPLSIKAPSLSGRDLGILTGAKLLWTAIVSIPLAAGIGVMVYLVGYPQHIPLAALALMGWQLHETCRRSLMAHLHYHTLLLGDAIKAAGWPLATLLMIQLQTVNLGHVMAALAMVCFMAAGVQAVQARVSFRWTASFLVIGADAWRLGRFILISSVIGFLIMQFFGWMLAIFHGLEANARIQAMMLVLGVLHPIMISISNVLLPAVAHAHSENGSTAARRVGYSYGAVGATLILPYVLALILMPEIALRLFFGSESPYIALTLELRIFSFVYLLGYFSQVITGVLNAERMVRAGLATQATGAFVALVVGIPMIVQWGLMGSILAGLTVYCMQISVGALYHATDLRLPWRTTDSFQGEAVRNVEGNQVSSAASR